ncbi:hypothetical protein Droror1_Dr00021995 [Drosera rotundifolia]
MLHRRRNPNRSPNADSDHRRRLTIPDSHAAFRLLCPASIAGDVIRHSGSVVGSIERRTTARFDIDRAVSRDSDYRLVHIVGDSDVDAGRTIRLSDGGGGGGDERDVDVYEVSAAQEALIRVYEWVLEVYEEEEMVRVSEEEGRGGEGGGLSCCCCMLLAVSEEVKRLIGRGGKRIERIRKESGADGKELHWRGWRKREEKECGETSARDSEDDRWFVPLTRTPLHEFWEGFLKFCYLACFHCCGATVKGKEKERTFLEAKRELLWMLLLRVGTSRRMRSFRSWLQY